MMISPDASAGPEGDHGAAKSAGGVDRHQQQHQQQQHLHQQQQQQQSSLTSDSGGSENDTLPSAVVMRSASRVDAERNRDSLLSEDSFFAGHDAPAMSGAVSSSSTAAMAGLGSLPTSASPSGATGAGGGGVSPIPPMSSSTPADRKESYKAQRKNYAKQKKRVGKELLSTFKDQSIIVLADWLKIRGSLKSWTKLWCVLKPGLLLIYRSQKAKSSHWIGTIMLSTCELIERPSKKDGFCFKLFHPMDMSIWASRGPEGEAIGAVSQPLPTSHLIFRAPNNAAGKCWMDALELALRCSSLLLRTMSATNTLPKAANANGENGDNGQQQLSAVAGNGNGAASTLPSGGHNDSDMENHFKSELEGDCGNMSSGCEGQRRSTENEEDDFDLGDDLGCEEEEEDEDEDDECDSDYSEDSAGENTTNGKEEETSPEAADADATEYQDDPAAEVFGTAGDQTEEISDENKSIVWFLVKQVRPGMDLSRVVLPTFILEPRSFLDKLSDHYYHADLLSEAVKENSPLMRMQKVVKWYLSGLYKKPKGLKKPYNPILGETFRCYWQHPSGSKTFYIAEQVSHHPPISAFYVTNRREGFTVASSILAKSKFYGNSTSAILEGTGKVSLLPRGEDYLLTMPYAHCKGILMGTMTMELGGKINIDCERTGYNVEMEFKLKPFLGGGEFTNAVSGKLRLGKETLFTIDGRWDDTVTMRDKKTGKEEVLWKVTPDVRNSRLKRFTVPLESQGEFESVRLWRHVSKAIGEDDQVGATEEKSKLEEEQRAGARERKATGEEWVPRLFELDSQSEQYEYRHADLRPWDDLNDQHQFERGFVVCTKTRHKTPMIRTQSIVSVSEHAANKDSPKNAAAAAKEEKGTPAKSIKARRRKKVSSISMAEAAKAKRDPQDSTASTIPEEPMSALVTESSANRRRQLAMINSSSGSGGSVNGERLGNHLEEVTDGPVAVKSFSEALKPMEEQQRLTNERLAKLQHSVEVMSYQQREQRDASNALMSREVVLVCLLVVVLQVVINWFLAQHRLHDADPSSPGSPPPPPPPSAQ